LKPFATTLISTSLRVVGLLLAALAGVVVVLGGALFAVAMMAAVSLARPLTSMRREAGQTAEEPQLSHVPAR
jgi:hypothetical protein